MSSSFACPRSQNGCNPGVGTDDGFVFSSRYPTTLSRVSKGTIIDSVVGVFWKSRRYKDVRSLWPTRERYFLTGSHSSGVYVGGTTNLRAKFGQSVLLISSVKWKITWLACPCQFVSMPKLCHLCLNRGDPIRRKCGRQLIRNNCWKNLYIFMHPLDDAFPRNKPYIRFN